MNVKVSAFTLAVITLIVTLIVVATSWWVVLTHLAAMAFMWKFAFIATTVIVLSAILMVVIPFIERKERQEVDSLQRMLNEVNGWD